MELDCSQDIILENDISLLTPLKKEHHRDLLSICINQPDLLKYSPVLFGTSEYLKQYIDQAITRRASNNWYSFVIYDKLKKQFAGSTSFLNISNHDSRLEIGATWLAKDFQRSGLNRSNKFLMLEYAFEKLNCERVELKTDDRNEQSKTAIQKIGAKYEGTLRSHTLMTDGYRRDNVYFSILKSEWPAIKSSIFKNYV